MSNLSGNKFFAGVLISLVVLKGVDFVSSHVMQSPELCKNSYLIDTSSLKDSVSSNAMDEKEAPDILPFLTKANLQNGEVVFKKCLQCHTVNKGGMDKVGPNLWGVVMNTYAHKPDFTYSEGIKNQHGKQKWTFNNLNHFLFKPKKHIPGTKMSFVGIKDDQERADVILYLRSLSDQPVKIE